MHTRLCHPVGCSNRGAPLCGIEQVGLAQLLGHFLWHLPGPLAQGCILGPACRSACLGSWACSPGKSDMLPATGDHKAVTTCLPRPAARTPPHSTSSPSLTAQWHPTMTCLTSALTSLSRALAALRSLSAYWRLRVTAKGAAQSRHQIPGNRNQVSLYTPGPFSIPCSACLACFGTHAQLPAPSSP